jgi:hypothetical protein
MPQIRTDEAKRPFVWVTSVKNPPVRLRRSTAAKKAAPPVLPELPADQ